MFRYPYALKVHQKNTPFSCALLCSFNPLSNKFGSNISLSTLTDKNGFTVDEQCCNRIKSGATEPGFTQQIICIFQSSPKYIPLSKIRPKCKRFISSPYLSFTFSYSFLKLCHRQRQSFKKCYKGLHSAQPSHSKILIRSSSIGLCHFRGPNTSSFRPLHYLVLPSSGLGIPCVSREAIPHFTGCVYLFTSAQVKNILRKQLCSARSDRCANWTSLFF